MADNYEFLSSGIELKSLVILYGLNHFSKTSQLLFRVSFMTINSLKK